MKKLFVLAMTLVMLVFAMCVGAKAVELKIEPMLNYSSYSSMSVEFTTSEGLAEAAFGMAGMAPDIIDPVMLFKTLLSFDGTATVKADVSEDYNKIKMYMQTDCDYDVDVNPNLGVALDLNVEMWFDMDISDLNNPKCSIIMYTPMSTKYMYCDLFDYIPDDQSRLVMFAMLKAVLNEEFISDINEAMTDAYEKYAEMTVEEDVLTIKVSNYALLKMIDEIIPVFVDKFASILPAAKEQLEGIVIPSVADMGIQILGMNGIVVKYNTKDYSSEITCDININLKDFAAKTVGEDLPFGQDITIGLTMTGTEKYYDIGSTVVVLPELTEENSLDLIEYFKSKSSEDEYYEEDYYEEENIEEYPFFYASACSYYMPEVEGKLYVPFRALLEDAYGGNVNIGFEKGLITVTSDYFTEFEKLSFKTGESKVNVDGTEQDVGLIVLKDGVTYVSTDFIETVFGWELDSASYDYIYGEYYFGFYTESMDDEWYEEATEEIA